eukprot:TRINITY_DN4947_c0_g1_i1.p2 TRINITY_DN4947_c0_g1~~TRINITY_DN4947_c0_g1_i1.p2  ORF type:complete len:197 (+),score=76.83 TRINITY_DN4947_c0_g1_i1:622-1212(+)
MREKRERAAKYVSDQVEQVERDDAKDALAEELFEALERQFSTNLHLLEIEKGLGMGQDVSTILVTLGEGAGAIARRALEAKRRLALAQEDLRSLEAAGYHAKEAVEIDGNPTESQERIHSTKDLQQQIFAERVALKEEIVATTKDFRQRRATIQDAIGDVGFTAAELRLRGEVRGCGTSSTSWSESWGPGAPVAGG